MGICVSVEIRQQIVVNREIEIRLETERQQKPIRLLLLGIGGSGKTTILKQMIILHDDGFSDFDLKMRKQIIHKNILESMVAIIKAMKKLEIRLDNLALEVEARAVCEVLEIFHMDPSDNIFSTMYLTLHRLWHDKGLQSCFARRNEYLLEDCAKYFFDNLARISELTYVPTYQDILYSRAPTSGVHEVKFKALDSDFRVYDVGGQRAERRKWIHLFDIVDSVIFIAALSCYNMVVLEDEEKNQMDETIDLFKMLLNLEWFRNKDVILFLNKKDIFEQMLGDFPLNEHFSDYNGGPYYDVAISYLHVKFRDMVSNGTRTTYIHETCATDTTQVENVIDSVLNLVTKFNIGKSGME